MKSKVSQEFIDVFFHNGTVVNDKFAFMPFWIELIDKEKCIIEMHQLGRPMPLELKEAVADFRLEKDELINIEALIELGFECMPVETWTGNGTESSETSKTVQQDYVKWFSDLSNAFIVRYEEWYWRKEVGAPWNVERNILIYNSGTWYPKTIEGQIHVMYDLKYMSQLNDIFKVISGRSLNGK